MDGLERVCGGEFALDDAAHEGQDDWLCDVLWQSRDLSHIKIILESGIPTGSKAHILAQTQHHSLAKHLDE